MNQLEEQPMKNLGRKKFRPLKTNNNVENMVNLEQIVWDALICDDVEKLREINENGPASAAIKICEKMSGTVCHNSFKCLEYVLEIYDQLPDSSRSEITWFDGKSPLFTITKECCWAAMRIVEKHPSFIKDVVDEPECDGSTPLLVAVKRNHTEVVKWLMNNSERKLKIDRRNCRGETAIYLATLNGQADVIKEMLEKCTYKTSDRKGEKVCKSSYHIPRGCKKTFEECNLQ